MKKIQLTTIVLCIISLLSACNQESAPEEHNTKITSEPKSIQTLTQEANELFLRESPRLSAPYLHTKVDALSNKTFGAMRSEFSRYLKETYGYDLCEQFRIKRLSKADALSKVRDFIETYNLEAGNQPTDVNYNQLITRLQDRAANDTATFFLSLEENHPNEGLLYIPKAEGSNCKNQVCSQDTSIYDLLGWKQQAVNNGDDDPKPTICKRSTGVESSDGCCICTDSSGPCLSGGDVDICIHLSRCCGKDNEFWRQPFLGCYIQSQGKPHQNLDFWADSKKIQDIQIDQQF